VAVDEVTALDRKRPAAIGAINRVGGALGRIGVQPRLDVAGLIRAACKQTGLDDFGGDDFRPGLDRLVASLEDDARLTTLGRIAARTRIVRLLVTRLQLVDHAKHHPEVAAQEIHEPVFVLGLPRTGTTVLYGLLAADPSFRSPVSWEVATPVPPPNRDVSPDDPRIRAAEKDFDQLRRIAPGVDAIHPLGALLPQECMSLQAPSFLSYEFPTTFPVHGYWAWLQEQDLTPAYEQQKRYLQHLQSGYASERWILKTPAHLLSLDVLLDVFPDARVIQTHRDPTTVIASVSSLMYALRSAVSDHVDPADVGRDQLATWSRGLEEALRIRDARLPADRVIDVDFRDTVDDPVATVQRIHDHFGWKFDDQVAAGIRAYLDENPRTKHGRHTYALEQFGLTKAQADQAFAGYRARFGMTD